MPVLKEYKSSIFYNEKAKKAYEKTKAAAKAQKDLFDSIKAGQQMPEKGILIDMKFVTEKSQGVGRIIAYDKIENFSFSERDERIEVSLNGKSLYFGVEAPDYPFRLTEPYNRSEPESNIPITAGKLQVMETFKDGRIFIQEEPNISTHHSIINNLTGKFSRVEEYAIALEAGQAEKFKSTLTELLQEKTNLPLSDAQGVTEEVAKRIL